MNSMNHAWSLQLTTVKYRRTQPVYNSLFNPTVGLVLIRPTHGLKRAKILSVATNSSIVKSTSLNWTTNLKSRVIDVSDTLVVKVVSKSKNEVRAHLGSGFGHHACGGRLNGGDVRRIRQTSPISNDQEPDGRLVTWCTRKKSNFSNRTT